MIYAIRDLLLLLLQLYFYVVIAAVVMSWLIAFGVINIHNQLARSVITFLQALTEPVFRPVRRLIPPMGGFDLSPVIVLIAIWFLQRVIISVMV